MALAYCGLYGEMSTRAETRFLLATSTGFSGSNRFKTTAPKHLAKRLQVRALRVLMTSANLVFVKNFIEYNAHTLIMRT
jgi:hypothetical protein